MTPANAIWLGAYVIYVAAIVGGMFYAQSVVIAEYDTPEARIQWEKWKEKARTESTKWAKEHELKHEAPIDRRPPTSEEPPVLIQMRDNFFTCLFIAVFFGSLLFGMMAFAIRGAFSGDEGTEKVDSPTASQPDA